MFIVIVMDTVSSVDRKRQIMFHSASLEISFQTCLAVAVLHEEILGPEFIFG